MGCASGKSYEIAWAVPVSQSARGTAGSVGASETSCSRAVYGIHTGGRYARAGSDETPGGDSMSTKEAFEIEGRKLVLTNLEKVYFPEINGTKAELIEYYLHMARYILRI